MIRIVRGANNNGMQANVGLSDNNVKNYSRPVEASNFKKDSEIPGPLGPFRSIVCKRELTICASELQMLEYRVTS